MTPNRRVVSRNAAFGFGGLDAAACRNVGTVQPTDDFTVNVPLQAARPLPAFQFGTPLGSVSGQVYIGFSTQRIAPSGTNFQGTYVLLLSDGTLQLPSQSLFNQQRSGYCDGVTHGTVRCVADRASGTIRFHVNGVDKGVAYRNVPPGPLYAVVMFPAEGVVVELV